MLIYYSCWVYQKFVRTEEKSYGLITNLFDISLERGQIY